MRNTPRVPNISSQFLFLVDFHVPFKPRQHNRDSWISLLTQLKFENRSYDANVERIHKMRVQMFGTGAAYIQIDEIKSNKRPDKI